MATLSDAPQQREFEKPPSSALPSAVKGLLAAITLFVIGLWGFELLGELRLEEDFQRQRSQDFTAQLAGRLNLTLALQAQTALTILQTPRDRYLRLQALHNEIPILLSLVQFDRDGQLLSDSAAGSGDEFEFAALLRRSRNQVFHYSNAADGQTIYLTLNQSDGSSILRLGKSALPPLLEYRPPADWVIENDLTSLSLSASNLVPPTDSEPLSLLNLNNSDWQLRASLDTVQMRHELLPKLLIKFLSGSILALLPLLLIWLWQRRQQREYETNQALLETRRRYQDVFEGSGAALCVLDLTALDDWLKQSALTAETLVRMEPAGLEHAFALLRITEINHVAMRLLEVRTPEQAMARLLELSPAQSGFGLNLMQSMLDSRKPRELQLEVRLPTAQAEERHLWLLLHLPENSRQYPTVMLSIGDITSRKRIELSLQEREAFWSEVVRTVPDHLYVQDVVSQRMLYSNHHLGHSLGYDKLELQEMGEAFWEMLLHPKDADQYRQAREQQLRDGHTQLLQSQLRFRHHSGAWRWFDVREQALSRDNDQKVDRVIGVAKDITDQMEASFSLRDSEQRYRMLAESISDVIFSCDRQLKIDYISPSVVSVLGFSAAYIIDNGLHNTVANPLQLGRFYALIGRVKRASGNLERMEQLRHELTTQLFLIDCLHADGHRLPVELRLVLMWDDQANFEGVLGVGRDISQQRRAEKDLRMAATVFEHSTSAILITDPAGYIVQANEAFTRVSGYTLEHVIDQLPKMLTVDDQQASHLGYILKQLNQRGAWEGEVWLRRRNGEKYPAWVGITAVLDDEGDLASYVCFFSDISERKASEERIHRLAYYDALTHLPNRTLFQDRLHTALQQAERQNAFVVLMFLDLDRFKPINDSLGHAAGDRMFKDMATRLLACVDDDDTVARMGGDEFTLLLQPRATREAALNQAVRVAEQILLSLVKPFVLENREFFVTASIGIALSPQDGSELSQLMKNADTAMYHAKEHGKNNFQFYQADMNASALERLELESDLRHALEQEEFVLYYQPQFSGDGKRLTGVEALIRWRHPTRGLVPPSEFIPVLEELGLVVEVGDWVLKEACRQLKAWHVERVRVPKVSVNISARQFADGQLGARIATILADSGMSPACLELELTESVLMNDVAMAMQILAGIKSLGLSIAVDDFGTGYSSLNYLKQFPIDVLKIDRSFVDGLPSGEQDAQIARAIIAMAHSLNLSVIAEGVETHEQLEFLREHGCDEVQGYLFGRPMSANHFGAQFSNDALFMLE